MPPEEGAVTNHTNVTVMLPDDAIDELRHARLLPR